MAYNGGAEVTTAKVQMGVKLNVDGDGDGVANFEEAMLLTGYGRYNIVFLLVCGFVAIAVGCQYSTTAYVLPSAQCDLSLSSSQMGYLNSAFLIGAMLSAISSGAIADAMGRRRIMLWSLVIDGFVTLLSSLSQNFITLFIFRFINGIVIGGPSSLLFTMFGEFHGEKFRAAGICYLGFFWSVSWIVLPALAWMVIPIELNIVVYGFTYNSWQLFISIIAAPLLISGFLLSLYPETPKFLLSQGEHAKALEIMKQIYAANTNRITQDFPVKRLVFDDAKISERGDSLSGPFKNMWKQLCCIFSSPLLKYTILVASMLGANMFGYYGLGLWFPELFNRFENFHVSHPNESLTICEMAYLQSDNDKSTIPVLGMTENSMWTRELEPQNMSTTILPYMQVLTESTTELCNISVDQKVFVNTIIIGFSCLIGNLASGYLMNRMDRRVLPIATQLLAGLSGCAIYLLKTSTQNLIAASMFSAFSSMANMIIIGRIVDLFPTNVSAITSGVATLSGRAGAILSNVLFGLLLDVSCEVPIFFVGSVVIAGGIIAFFVPTHPLALPKPS
ncbi:synaptic vesicle glycoprotein 2B-like isoform X1 [Athalia rosae]|uniref:synaptic vesicle glycoprotein 2B-like isoform X1 n=2 Tax=Athalia rosae TaxID=37344 RepID=UPI0020338E87|nr:synaptic vesicle glycoprotein 2B-like isoform X1 [Athalia rosae]